MPDPRDNLQKTENFRNPTDADQNPQMTEAHEISLKGCTPEPLMNYLKALGVLRLVAEQADPDARGAWRGGVMVLQSRLTREELAAFFQGTYQPTPLVSPWNGDGGFLTETGSSADTIREIKARNPARFGRLQEIIHAIEQIALLREFARNRDLSKELTKKKQSRKITEAESEELKRATSRVKEIKSAIVSQLRGSLPDASLVWLDACLQIEEDGFFASPVLGSGGCDGRMEFSANYLANLLLVDDDARSGAWWAKAVLNEGNVQLIDTAIGQFAPGRIGGPNGTQGMEGSSMLNPWDYVLMMEGVVLLAGSVCRKLSVDRRGRAAFPFTVLASDVGSGTLERAESRESRGELWLPLWDRFTGLAEVTTMFAEGRSQLARRQSQTAVDFARAVAGLGVDRGIRSFSRQVFLKRNGLAFLATPLGRFDVQQRDGVQLLREIDDWLERFRRACGDKAPARFVTALQSIDAAIFDYCRFGGKPQFTQILCALGHAERELASGGRFRDEARIPALAGLSPAWLDAANDQSVELELALSLAGLHDSTNQAAPLRAYLEPVEWKRSERMWAEKAGSVVWTRSNLSANLTAVLARQLMENQSLAVYQTPLRASFAAVAAYLWGEVDDQRLEDLLWGAILVNRRTRWPVEMPRRDESLRPRVYALLKLLFLLDPLQHAGTEIPIRCEADILPALRRGDVGQACRIALRRLRASGITPMPHRRAAAGIRDGDWEESACGLDPRRLTAALLFPISANNARRLCQEIARPEARETETTF